MISLIIWYTTHNSQLTMSQFLDAMVDFEHFTFDPTLVPVIDFEHFILSLSSLIIICLIFLLPLSCLPSTRHWIQTLSTMQRETS